MARKAKRAGRSASDKGSDSARHKSRTQTADNFSLSQRTTTFNPTTIVAERKRAFVFIDEVRNGEKVRDAEELAGISKRTAKQLLPASFNPDGSVRSWDRYTRYYLKPTTVAGEYVLVRARGLGQARKFSAWSNAVKAFARNNTEPIALLRKKYPRGLFVGGVRLSLADFQVQKIAEAIAESDEALEQPLSSWKGAR